MISDSAIKSKVQIELGVRDLLGGGDVEIRVQDGRVVLTGKVDSNETADAITRICWTIEGVSGVDSMLDAAA